MSMDFGAVMPTDHPHHQFVGRHDRWCEVCALPDRHPIHKDAQRVPNAIDTLRRCLQNPTLIYSSKAEARLADVEALLQAAEEVARLWETRSKAAQALAAAVRRVKGET